MTAMLEERLEEEQPEVLEHLRANSLEIDRISPIFLTLFVYETPIEIATRLFEVFILDGDMALISILMRMIELKAGDLLDREDMELQNYVLRRMTTECVEEYSVGYLLDDVY